MGRHPSRLAGVVATGALLCAGCTGAGAARSANPTVTRTVTPTPAVFQDAGVTVARLGKVAIPVAAPTALQPLATPGHLQLVTMGDTVVVRPAAGTEAGIVALGPDLATRPGPVLANGRAPGTIAVTVRVTRGSIRLSPQDFVARDSSTRVTALRTTDRPTVVRAGHSATITFTGVFIDGGAVFEWLPAGGRLVVWDFHVELD